MYVFISMTCILLVHLALATVVVVKSRSTGLPLDRQRALRLLALRAAKRRRLPVHAALSATSIVRSQVCRVPSETEA
jgi:hypothetical protein